MDVLLLFSLAAKVTVQEKAKPRPWRPTHFASYLPTRHSVLRLARAKEANTHSHHCDATRGAECHARSAGPRVCGARSTKHRRPRRSHLARIRAVSRPMRDAVGVRGHRLKNYGQRRCDDAYGYCPAAYRGCLSTLKHVCRQGHLRNLHYKPIFNSASQGGHLEVLQWLRSIGFQMDGAHCWRAAEGGHREVLKWLRANGCPWDGNTCMYAPWGGHLDVLQWLRANGCPWDESTCAFAAKGGHLEMLQWARANGCPWDKKTREYAGEIGTTNY